MSDRMPKYMSDKVPDRMSEYMSYGMPDQMSEMECQIECQMEH